MGEKYAKNSHTKTKMFFPKELFKLIPTNQITQEDFDIDL